MSPPGEHAYVDHRPCRRRLCDFEVDSCNRRIPVERRALSVIAQKDTQRVEEGCRRTCTRHRAIPPNVATTFPLGCSWLSGFPAPTPTTRPGPDATTHVTLAGKVDTRIPVASVVDIRSNAISYAKEHGQVFKKELKDRCAVPSKQITSHRSPHLPVEEETLASAGRRRWHIHIERKGDWGRTKRRRDEDRVRCNDQSRTVAAEQRGVKFWGGGRPSSADPWLRLHSWKTGKLGWSARPTSWRGCPLPHHRNNFACGSLT